MFEFENSTVVSDSRHVMLSLKDYENHDFAE